MVSELKRRVVGRGTRREQQGLFSGKEDKDEAGDAIRPTVKGGGLT